MLSDDPYFDTVYADSYPVLLRYAMLRLSDPFDAEDVLQNVYVRFLRRLERHGHADIEQPGAFLLRMLRNEIAVHYASRAARQAREQALDDARLPADEPDLALRAATREEAEAVFAAAKTLPGECYRAFVLYYGFDMSVEEIAAALHVSRDAVKSRLFRARRGIRARLAAEPSRQPDPKDRKER